MSHGALVGTWEQRLRTRGKSPRDAHSGMCVRVDPALSVRAAVARQARRAFPVDGLQALHERGTSALHVPVALGGTGGSVPELLAVTIAVARRDPSLALTVGMQVWSAAVFAAGSEETRGWLADLVLSGASPCLAVSEADHGAELLATSTVVADGRLTGEKWPIGRTVDAPVALVLARDGDRRGPRGLSLWAAPLRDEERGPRERTTGFRSAWLAGLTFRDRALPDTARVGEPGGGLELVLRLFQLTRVLVVGIGLGAADLALRTATRFAEERRLYGAPLIELPAVGRRLARAFHQLRRATLVTASAARCAHTRPEELGHASLVAKIVAGEASLRVTEAAAEVVGARALMEDGPLAALAMARRDVLAVPVFDGSSAVCLTSLAARMPALLASPADPDPTRIVGDLPPRERLPALAASPVDGALEAVDDDARVRLAERHREVLADGVRRDPRLLDLAAAWCALHADALARRAGLVEDDEAALHELRSWVAGDLPLAGETW
ncbi:MAG: acyl-CoA dehydrogenase family protein [Alphaproteobacteria bacterium]|nr:acyl-CoA dehydrogenase family protein [Alphaproteobacteria bacterium]MCB9697199.1 acyl-CoA dehydrogenase family protein [Alphaproteobacteria bacterium]